MTGLFPLTHWNGQPITNDTATVDLATLHANMWNTVIKCGAAKRSPSMFEGRYYWTVQMGNDPRKIVMTTTETRRRAIDGSLYEYIREQREES